MTTPTQNTREATRGEMAERRERIATAAMQGMLAWPSGWPLGGLSSIPPLAVQYADALIAELDKDTP